MLIKVSYFYVRSFCGKKLLFKLKGMTKNVKRKAGLRWKCVLKSMFILLFTRINYAQSSIISKLLIFMATHEPTKYYIIKMIIKNLSISLSLNNINKKWNS